MGSYGAFSIERHLYGGSILKRFLKLAFGFYLLSILAVFALSFFAVKFPQYSGWYFKAVRPTPIFVIDGQLATPGEISGGIFENEQTFWGPKAEVDTDADVWIFIAKTLEGLGDSGYLEYAGFSHDSLSDFSLEHGVRSRKTIAISARWSPFPFYVSTDTSFIFAERFLTTKLEESCVGEVVYRFATTGIDKELRDRCFLDET